MNKKKKYLDEINAIPKEKSMGYYAPKASEINGIPTHNLPEIEIVAENPYKLTDYQKAQANKITDNFRRGQYLKEQDYYNRTGKNKFTDDIRYIGTESQKRLANVALATIPGVGTIQPFIKYEDGKVKGDFSKKAFIQSGINTVLDFVPVGDLIGNGVKNIVKPLKTNINRFKNTNPSISNSTAITNLANIKPLDEINALKFLREYIKEHNIDPSKVTFTRSHNNSFAQPIDPTKPDEAKHVIYGFNIPLSSKTKEDIVTQSLPRLNRLLHSDYSIAYYDVLKDLNERILIHHNRKSGSTAGGYFNKTNPDRINRFTDDTNPNTSHHEAMHAVIANLDDADINKLYKIADELFNKNGLAMFSSDVSIDNLFKRQDELASIAFDPSKSKAEVKQAMDEFSKLEEVKRKGLEEILTTISESRPILLKDKIKANASVEEQDMAIDAASAEEILEALKKANGYGANYINQILKNNGGQIPQFIIDNIRKAYKIFPMGIPAAVINKNDKKQ